MKKLISCLVLVSFLITSYPVFATDGGSASMAKQFTVLCIEYPQGDELFNTSYSAYSHLFARFADDKTPIPLSQYYDGRLFATVPNKDASRPIEAFIAEEKSFTDWNEDNFLDFHYLESLSATGVINGDEEGRANPKSEITRAEVVAMIMRFLGLSEVEGTTVKFEDVNKDDWFYNVIAAANRKGIVLGDSDTVFSPERSITREEFVAMLSRAVYTAGLKKFKSKFNLEYLKNNGYVAAEDLQSISEWAIAAYCTLMPFETCEYVETDKLDQEGVPVYDKYYYPQKNITRCEVAEAIWRVQDNFQFYPSRIAEEYGFDVQMPIIDGSTSTYPFTEAVYQNLFSSGLFHPSKPVKHSKSHASYEKLINGNVDMLFASVYPASDVLELAKENGVEIGLIPIAYDAMVFFTNASNSAENLTTEQITNIYVDDKYENWNQIGGPDALLYPYCRNNDSGSHAQMERHFLNGNEINEKIRNETTSISMSNVLTDVMGAQTDYPTGFALGYSIYYYFNNMDLFYDTKTQLKLLSIDGVYPSDETIADGTYPLSNNTYIAYIKNSPGEERALKMADFMLTEVGQVCVAEAGFGPLKGEKLTTNN